MFESGISSFGHAGLSEVLAPYAEFLKFNIGSPLEARVFLLAEEHLDDKCLFFEKNLVNFLASEGPVILLHEGFPSGEVDETKDYKWKFDPVVKRNIHIVGWDVSMEVIRRIASLRCLYGIKKEVDEWSCKVKAQGVEKNALRWKEREVEITQIEETIRKRTGMSMQELAVKGKEFSCVLAETFPMRTEAMISTLRALDAIECQLGIERAKVVLIAGAMHLKVDRRHEADPRFDLKSLYQELEARHKAVILIPPHIMYA